MMKRKRKILCLLLCILLLLVNGCHLEEKTEKFQKNIDFVICKKENIPNELKKIIDKKLKKPFQLSYKTKEYTYLVIGYGEQSMIGYHIQVRELYEQSNQVVVKANLKSPKVGEGKQGVSYPYFVIKIQNVEKPISFQ